MSFGAPSQNRLCNAEPTLHNRSPLRIDSKPRANGILDTIYVSRAHGIRTPVEFQDPLVLKTLEQAVVHEW